MTIPPLNKILYVEDEPRIRSITKMALEKAGFIVQECDTGKAAVEAAPRFQPHLILMDVRMPGMDGPATLRALRDMSGFEATPIVFMTAGVTDKDMEDYIAMGAADVITKPFKPTGLPDRLKEIWFRSVPDEPAESDDEMERIQESFRAELAEWLQDIISMGRMIGTDKAEGDPKALVESLRERAHQVAGTAGTFGFEEIGDAALELELLCVALLEHGDTADLSKIGAAMAALETAAAALTDT
ncbi:MAG: response regulator [Rhodospirillales bacterium]|jgi:CheY-like chemotaxis protein|nr:response regulator [Rhodospirillales bacterium]